ncbi:MAG: DUF5011 domain-containing protein [Gammaproteobacteria bacterium]|nr:DUF5011 domain-containing protein [Gammaproteobacteria bacterium]
MLLVNLFLAGSVTTVSAHEKHPNILINAAEIATIKSKISITENNGVITVTGEEPWRGAAEKMMKQAKAALDLDDMSVTKGGKNFCGANNIFCTERFYGADSDRYDWEKGAKPIGIGVRDLGMAYAFTGKAVYADKLIQLVRVWALNPETAMQPKFGNNQALMDIFGTMSGLIYGVDLAWNYPGWDKADKAAFKSWVLAFGNNTVYAFGQAETNSAPNNFENWRNAFLSITGAFVGDKRLLDIAYRNYKTAIDNQIHWSGRMGQESGRDNGWAGLGYSVYAAHAMVLTAEVARHQGKDLYNYLGEDAGGNPVGLKTVFDFLVPYVINPASWEWSFNKDYPLNQNFNANSGVGIYELAYSVWGEQQYLNVVNKWGRPLGMNMWALGVVTLTHANRDLSFDPVAASILTHPESITVTEGEGATFSVVAAGSGTLAYQWYFNGGVIEGANNASYTLTGVSTADIGTYGCTVTNNLGSDSCVGATLEVLEDAVAPTLVSALATSAMRVNLLFSETVSTASAETSANYALNLGINVTAASLNADKRTVSLTVSPLTEDTTYEVSVSNVQDRAQTPNTINPSSKTFTYRTIYTFDGVNPTDDWTPLNPGNWEVKTDEGDMSYYITSSSSPGNSLLGEYSLLPGRYGDFTLTAQARLDANGANADYAIVFGFQNADDYYYALFNNNQAFIELFKVSKGTRTALELVKPVDTDWLNDNAYHAIKVSREGSEIKVYFDDNLIMHASDSTFGVGQVGIGSFNDSAYFDDVQVVGQVTTAPDDSTPPVILLTGSSVITIAEGTAYNDLGATATYNKDDNDPLTQNINVVNPVDPNSPATYTVTYNVSDAAGNAAIEVTRTVIVTAAVVIEDNEAPVIALTGNSEITIAEGSAYNDLGATATDNKDDDSLLTQNINVVNPVDPNSPATYTVTYNVSDAAGNAAIEVTRTVIVTAAVVIDDNEAPVIALTGNSEITIAEGTVYNDLGATATDNKDEDTPLTQNINVVNPVDPNSPATYTVTYNVSDAAGNAAIEVTRTVIVTAAVANNPDESSGGGALNLSFVALALLLIGVRGRRRTASVTSTQV